MNEQCPKFDTQCWSDSGRIVLQNFPTLVTFSAHSAYSLFFYIFITPLRPKSFRVPRGLEESFLAQPSSANSRESSCLATAATSSFPGTPSRVSLGYSDPSPIRTVGFLIRSIEFLQSGPSLECLNNLLSTS